MTAFVEKANRGDDLVPNEESVPVIQTIDPETRWEDGVDHDPRTEELWDWLQEYDRKFCGYEYSDLLSSGGDGDPGEGIMYLIDEYFAARGD